MNKKRILVGVGVFVLSLGIGFLAAHLLSESPSKAVAIDTSIPTPTPEPDPTPTPTPVPDPTPTPEPNPIPAPPEPILKVESLKLTGKTYTLVVRCENAPTGVTVNYKILDISMESETGVFTKIPGSNSGKYTVVALNKDTKVDIARKEVSGFNIIDDIPVNKMSVSEFQTLLLNQGDNSLLGGKNPKVARFVSLKCVGLNDDDFPANDIQHVRDKIANGIWKSASVTSVGYNEQGQITSAIIRPIY